MIRILTTVHSLGCYQDDPLLKNCITDCTNLSRRQHCPAIELRLAFSDDTACACINYTYGWARDRMIDVYAYLPIPGWWSDVTILPDPMPAYSHWIRQMHLDWCQAQNQSSPAWRNRGLCSAWWKISDKDTELTPNSPVTSNWIGGIVQLSLPVSLSGANKVAFQCWSARIFSADTVLRFSLVAKLEYFSHTRLRY